MVLQAQELAPSGIMLVILSQKNAIFTKQNKDFKIWHLKGSDQDLYIGSPLFVGELETQIIMM